VDSPLISFFVRGTPAPKGSSRPMLNRKTGKPFTFKGGSPQNAEKLTTWDNNVRAAAASAIGSVGAPPLAGRAIFATLEFRLVRPSGHWGKGKKAGILRPNAPEYPIGKPDIDKLARSTLDSLTGIVFDDDSRIATLLVTKTYAQTGYEGARITIEPMASDAEHDWS
jgi:crossover junction endodeoxyribonuclease RusA